VVKAQHHQPGSALYELLMTAAGMAWIWDHNVAGAPIVPGVLFLEMATACVQQTLQTGSSMGYPALSAISIPAACLLPKMTLDLQQNRVLLRCLVQPDRVQLASSIAWAGQSSLCVHLHAQPVLISNRQQASQPAGASGLSADALSWMMRQLPDVQRAAATATAEAGKVPMAAAVAAVAGRPGPAALSTGHLDLAQADAVLQLAAVQRGVLDQEIAAQLQVPAAAELYMSDCFLGQVASNRQLRAAVAVRPGLTAQALVADIWLQSGGSAGSVVTCNIIGLQAVTAKPDLLLRRGAFAASSTHLQEHWQEEQQEVSVFGN
jgi:hypothetical protein